MFVMKTSAIEAPCTTTIGGQMFHLKRLPTVANPSVYTEFLSEFLIGRIIAQRPTVAIDIGSGTGVLAIVLARFGVERVYAVDNNPDAVRLTKDNAMLNGVGHAVVSLESDVFSDIPSDVKADLIVSNPPAIPMNARPSDPYLSNFYAGPEGRDVIEGIIRGASVHLRNGGSVRFVHTSLVNIGATVRRFTSCGFDCKVRKEKQVPFRDFYYSYRDTIDELYKQGKSFFLSEGTSRTELLYLVEAKSKDR